jgi:hypothetical protein
MGNQTFRTSILMGACLFHAAVSGHAQLLLLESFDYGEAALTEVSNGQWITHSGTAGQIHSSGNEVFLTQARTEDVHALLEDHPFAPDIEQTLYAAFTLRFTALPSAAGTYFTHFRAGNNQNFRGRLFALTGGAEAGYFRLGISAGGNAALPSPVDLELERRYSLVLAYEVNSGKTTLWIDPQSESDFSVSSEDEVSLVPIHSFALRQASGMGSLFLGNLRIGTAFHEVHETASGEEISVELSVSREQEKLILRWPSRAGMKYSLWKTERVTAPFQILAEGLEFTSEEGIYEYGSVTDGSSAFFRLTVH